MSENKKDYRWWEFYFIRYLIGTIIGTAIVSYIAFYNADVKDSLTSQTNTETWFDLLEANYWIFILIGFAYCYIASAPILVFHTFRGYLKSTNGELNTATKCLSGLLFLAINVFLIITLFNDFKKFHECVRWITLFIVMIPQVVFLIMFLGGRNVLDYYKLLTKKRQEEKASIKRHEYVESYKHLREHGNAFSILLTEFVLCFVLVDLSITQVVSVLIIWTLPAAYVWLIGTNLEFGLSELD